METGCSLCRGHLPAAARETQGERELRYVYSRLARDRITGTSCLVAFPPVLLNFCFSPMDGILQRNAPKIQEKKNLHKCFGML